MLTFLSFLPVLLVLCSSWDYCIVGSGPGGIQLGYYLHKLHFNYVILERNSVPGSFFEVYPRSRTLISINKRHTGERNTEFNMRHDWNSLLSDDPEMVFKHYSNEMFPPAEAFLKYIKDYMEKFKLNVHFSRNIDHVTQDVNSEFTLYTSHNDVYQCTYLIVSTGIPKLHQMMAPGGREFVEGYDTVSHDPQHYEGLKVLILGKGNSGFETADMMYGNTDYVHLLSRDRVKLSWSTHYVGDVRGVNNQLLDTYQLKSLDALLENDVDTPNVRYHKRDGKLWVDTMDDVPELGPYDKIINCLGFQYDNQLFKNSSTGQDAKYPDMTWDYQSTTMSNLYYAGTITHVLDKRISSGGFIHGFRYTARALSRILAARNHGYRWPSVRVPLYATAALMARRMSEMSGPYQMFYILVDVYVKYEDYVEQFTDVPLGLLYKIHELLVEPRSTPIDMTVVRLEYGANYSKVGGDPFHRNRAELDQYLAHTCNFIHPVFYHFTEIPFPIPPLNKRLLGASNKLHLSEDLYTDFATVSRHLPVIQNFLGSVWKQDMAHYTSEECLIFTLTRTKAPVLCQNAMLVQNTQERAPLKVSPNLMRSTMCIEDFLPTGHV